MTLGEYQGVNVSQCYVANCQKIFQDATASTASHKKKTWEKMNVCDHLRPPISLNWIVYRRFLFLSLTSYNLLITYKLFHICGFRYIVLKREAIYFRLLLFVIYIFSLPRGNIRARIRVSRRELTKFHAIKLTSIRILSKLFVYHLLFPGKPSHIILT